MSGSTSTSGPAPGAEAADSRMVGDSRLVGAVRTWHRVLSYGEPAEEARWEREAWDDHVRGVRAVEGRRRAAWEIGRATAGHVRDRMLEGQPTAIPAGVLMLASLTAALLAPDPPPFAAHVAVSVAMAWAACMFLRWPTRFQRRAVLVNGVLWAVAMAFRHEGLGELMEADEAPLQTGHLSIFTGAVIMTVQAWRYGRLPDRVAETGASETGTAQSAAPDLRPAWIAFAVGAMLVAAANFNWSQAPGHSSHLIEMLVFAAVVALLGFTFYRIRNLPFVR